MQENDLFFYRYTVYVDIDDSNDWMNVDDQTPTLKLTIVLIYKQKNEYFSRTIPDRKWMNLMLVRNELVQCYSELLYFNMKNRNDPYIDLTNDSRLQINGNVLTLYNNGGQFPFLELPAEILMCMLSVSDTIDEKFRNINDILLNEAIREEMNMVLEFYEFVSNQITERDDDSLEWEEARSELIVRCRGIFEYFQNKEVIYDEILENLNDILKMKDIAATTIIPGLYDFCFVKQERNFWFYFYNCLHEYFIDSPDFKKVIEGDHEIEMQRRIETMRKIIEKNPLCSADMPFVVERYFYKFSPLFSFDAWMSTGDILIRKGTENFQQLGWTIKHMMIDSRMHRIQTGENLIQTQSISRTQIESIVTRINNAINYIVEHRRSDANQTEVVVTRFGLDYLINVLYYKILIDDRDPMMPRDVWFIETLRNICKRVVEANIFRQNTKVNAAALREHVTVYIQEWIDNDSAAFDLEFIE